MSYSAPEITIPAAVIGLTLSDIIRKAPGPVLVICEEAVTLQRLQDECQFYLGGNFPTMVFPDWETLPYDHFSPHEDIISARLKVMATLPQLSQGLVLATASTLMHRLPPVGFIAGQSHVYHKGDKIDIGAFRTRLQTAGYRAVAQVYQHGEYAVRGSIIDLFPMGVTRPIRIDLLDDEIDSLRFFDPETQRSDAPIDSLDLLPAHEFLLTDEATTQFRTAWRTRFTGDPMLSRIYQSVSEHQAPAGIEYYLPLFFKETTSLIDFLPKNAQLIKINDIAKRCDDYYRETEKRYEQYSHDVTLPILKPAEIIFNTSELLGLVNERNPGHLKAGPDETGKFVMLPPLKLEHAKHNPLAALSDFINTHKAEKILFSAESKGRRETLAETLKPLALHFAESHSWEDFLSAKPGHYLCAAPIEQGFIDKVDNIIVITEQDLLGEHVTQRRSKASKTSPEWVIKNLVELKIGEAVVHEIHGIGRYLGLSTLTIDDVPGEFLQLEYANKDKIYVPIQKLGMISRYSGLDNEHAPLTKLGSKQWDTAKRKAIEKIRDTAAELLNIYALREAKTGFAHSPLDSTYISFANSFPFEETPDQTRVIEEVTKDMLSPRPMDRLVCGDVGFGKTEVAMRAAFIGVNSAKQVAVLVPTTLLAEQHEESFKDRFADFPISIHSLSRFSSEKEKLNTINMIKEGKADIVIGTHALLNHLPDFKSLGLIIIDEEHRFGVHQKEKMKSIRANIDVLTLTATPIPRTLNMAMHTIRDLSIIASPPKRRLSIKTFVREYDEPLIKEAILREILRGGQVYYLHNKVETIQRTAESLRAWLPEAKVEVAHGQMRERDLEKTMSDFHHQRFNVLVCTTIIETGIDIPTANTIIIERADMFGLAQLHQLRGRVGRSHHQAYAYLFTPSEKKVTSDAEKRLSAIESLEDLGAGFMLATHDLEIRGAGEILGEEQSGHIQSIGFSLYTELLERAVKSIKSGKEIGLDNIEREDIEINLRIPALIPDTYIPDVHTRLIFYKRIASCQDNEATEELQVEMIDRFGLLPVPLKNLFMITKMRFLAKTLGIHKIEISAEGGYLEFTEQPKLNTTYLLNLIQTKSRLFKLKGQKALYLTFPIPEEERITMLQGLLYDLRITVSKT
ncbi:MAG: transcription-repair coupling factor [Gammaproteobacteria bacterium]